MLTTLSGPASKDIILSKGSFSGVGRSRISTFHESGLNFIFRSFGLLSAFALRSGVCLPLILTNGKCGRVRRHLMPVTRGLNVARLLGGCPCRMSNKRGRETTITHTLVAGPGLVLTSRPANTLSSGTDRRLLSLFDRVGGAKRAVLVMARSIETTDGTDHILFVGSNRIFRRVCHKSGAGRRLCRVISGALAVLRANNNEQ